MKQIQLPYWSVGFAMFSMFFGSGNIVFPVAIGQYAANQTPFAILGLLITAVFMPFFALCTILSFKGDYHRFFARIGAWPGFAVVVLIMALIGPFGVLPRCITVAYATMQLYFPQLALLPFSFFACILIFVLSVNKSKVVEILGFYLTPILLLSLFLITLAAFLFGAHPTVSQHSASAAFSHGFLEGYQTLDVFAALFFSTVIASAIKNSIAPHHLEGGSLKPIATFAFKASLVGAFLLGAIYAAMSLSASFYSRELAGSDISQQLGLIANLSLGSFGGLVANTAVSLACLTTAITLAVVFSEFVRVDLLKKTTPYSWILSLSLAISFAFCSLGFHGLTSFLFPVLKVLYPACIVLVFCNFGYRFFNFKPVLLPFYITLVLAFLFENAKSFLQQFL